MQHPQHKTFRGKCLVIIRPDGKSGNVTLKAVGNGLTPGQVVINAR
jgi:beta-galactosidase